MKNQSLYENSVNVLLDAYNSGNLEHANCSRCAVGNLCHEASLKTGIHNSKWKFLFTTYSGTNQEFRPYGAWQEEYIREAISLINETGYTEVELAKIEYAFENSIANTPEGHEYYAGSWRKEPQREVKKKGQFIGLCAVLDVLRDIHEVDKEEHEASHTRLETIYKKLQVA